MGYAGNIPPGTNALQTQEELMTNLAPGHIIGGCQIIRELTRGGMSTIYLAEQKSIGREVVLKVLSSRLLGDETFMHRFAREVSTTAKLQHPHIIPIYDYGQQGKVPYIVMAYLPGGSVDDILKMGSLSVNDAVEIVMQVAEALDHAHGNHVVHRDIKPGNILLDKDKNAVLTDFGIARIIAGTQDYTENGLVGTVAYLAPELMMTGQVITPAVDIYSMGCTLFRMVTNHIPYEADSTIQMMWAHAKDPVPSILNHNPELPHALDDIIRKAMSKSPGARYQDAEAMAKDLENLLRGRETMAERERPTDTQEFERPNLLVTGTARSLEEAVAEVMDQVVKIDRPDNSSGSGLALDYHLVITALHVVDGSPGIQVLFRNGATVTADVVAIDRNTDLALLRLRQRPLVGLEELPKRDFEAEPLIHGELLAAIGHPLGLDWSVTGGYYNGLRDPQHHALKRFGIKVNCQLIQVDVAVNPGNSGGPIIDLDGRIVGLADSIVNPAIANDIGFGIYGPVMYRFIDENKDAETPLIPYNDGQHHRPGLRFHPTTGKPITPIDKIEPPNQGLVAYDDGKERQPGLKYDPATGKPIKEVPIDKKPDTGQTQRYDPLTGKPLPPEG